MKIKIIVATHKEYSMPKDDIYLPVQAGRAIHSPLTYAGDDTGENISWKNRNYCELTALYWAWKNLDTEYSGLCHYRRYFAEKRWGRKRNRILGRTMAEKYLRTADVILPRKRNYFIETNGTQYIHAHHKQDLDTVRDILAEDYPEYLNAFEHYMKQTKGHHFNMFIMKKNIFDAYCTWLFDVMFKLEERLDISEYDEYNQRVFGFVSERLIDTWLDTNKIRYRELPVLNMENQHWLRKGTAFLIRKFRNTGKD